MAIPRGKTRKIILMVGLVKNNIETYKALTGETGGGYTRKQLAMMDRLKSILDERRN